MFLRLLNNNTFELKQSQGISMILVLKQLYLNRDLKDYKRGAFAILIGSNINTKHILNHLYFVSTNVVKQH